MSEYTMTAGRVDHQRCFIGIQFFLEAHRRVLGNNFGSIPEPLKTDAFDQGGYCIDAPESIPAGACEYFWCDADMGLPSQLQIERELT
jgi:hypothetical protein